MTKPRFIMKAVTAVRLTAVRQSREEVVAHLLAQSPAPFLDGEFKHVPMRARCRTGDEPWASMRRRIIRGYGSTANFLDASGLTAWQLRQLLDSFAYYSDTKSSVIEWQRLLGMPVTFKARRRGV
ncbi:hypothetical protein [Ramlibacter sp.]|uniref:hypothetical protein n=1 Tax=Ramlibacter sp. TaxID=1917967 RepID=UPI003D09868C